MFLPDSTNYSGTYQYFDSVYIAVIVTHIITIILKIAKQSSYDVFFIDWEKPKLEERQGVAVTKVNSWRTFFVANEFKEYMQESVINITTNYMIFYFFM